MYNCMYLHTMYNLFRLIELLCNYISIMSNRRTRHLRVRVSAMEGLVSACLRAWNPRSTAPCCLAADYLSLSLSIYIYIYTHIQYVYMYIYIYIYRNKLHTCVYIYIYIIYLFIYLFIHTYIHTYIHTLYIQYYIIVYLPGCIVSDWESRF